MHMKFISFIAGTAIILAGCASQATYPLSGVPAETDDAVQVMSAPGVGRY